MIFLNKKTPYHRVDEVIILSVEERQLVLFSRYDGDVGPICSPQASSVAMLLIMGSAPALLLFLGDREADMGVTNAVKVIRHLPHTGRNESFSNPLKSGDIGIIGASRKVAERQAELQGNKEYFMQNEFLFWMTRDTRPTIHMKCINVGRRMVLNFPV